MNNELLENENAAEGKDLPESCKRLKFIRRRYRWSLQDSADIAARYGCTYNDKKISSLENGGRVIQGVEDMRL